MKSPSEVSKTFNEMSKEYDRIFDLWYSWLFSRLHLFIARDVVQEFNPRVVLDVGSGSGYQSLLYSSFGAEVVGIDIAEELLRISKEKTVPTTLSASPLFPVHYRFVDEYNKRIDSLRPGGSKSKGATPPVYINADAIELPFRDNSFDHVNCCGSTLSLIGDYDSAISEISRVLRPGGTFQLEVEAKWNPDVFWTLIDILLNGRLGYDAPLKEALEPFSTSASQPVEIDYEISGAEDSYGLTIRLFTLKALTRDLRQYGLRLIKWRSIHSMTNLLPSTALDSSKPSTLLRSCFSVLSKIEETVYLPLPGCSLVLLTQKRD